MTQVGEWCHNKTPIEGQMRVVMEILHYIREQTNGAMTYWTVENNAIGEAALVVIRDTGEENFPGEMLHEPKKIQGKKGRRGYHTTHKSKIESCLTLKRLIEQDKLFLKSKPIVSELKNFVSNANSFKAKPGQTDDLVMSMVLALRMVDYISTFEDDVYNAVSSGLGWNSFDDEDGDDYDQPLPVI
jgi:hypothetical protein